MWGVWFELERKSEMRRWRPPWKREGGWDRSKRGMVRPFQIKLWQWWIGFMQSWRRCLTGQQWGGVRRWGRNSPWVERKMVERCVGEPGGAQPAMACSRLSRSELNLYSSMHGWQSERWVLGVYGSVMREGWSRSLLGWIGLRWIRYRRRWVWHKCFAGMREWQIGDVGGEMGFAGVREMGFTGVKEFGPLCSFFSPFLSLFVSRVMEFIFR